MIARRSFGDTGLQVSVLGLGTAEIGCCSTNISTVRSILYAAADAGINLIDSAAMYGNAEDILGQLLGDRRDDFLIVTKCGRHLPPLNGIPRLLRKVRREIASAFDLTPPDWQADALRQNIEQSLRRLRTDRLDVVLLHSCTETMLKRGDCVRVLQRAQREGKVRYIGYSGDGAAALYAVRSGLFQVLEVSVNIADQEAIDAVIPEALSRGLGVIAKRPIANVVWHSATLPQSPHLHVYYHRMRELDYEFTREPDAIGTALGFVLRTGVHTAIVGTTSLAHMTSNIEAAAETSLPVGKYREIRDRWLQVATPDWIGQI